MDRKKEIDLFIQDLPVIDLESAITKPFVQVFNIQRFLKDKF